MVVSSSLKSFGPYITLAIGTIPALPSLGVTYLFSPHTLSCLGVYRQITHEELLERAVTDFVGALMGFFYKPSNTFVLVL